MTTLEEPTDPQISRAARLRAHATSAGKQAGAATQIAGGALVEAVGNLADAAVDHVLLTDKRVTSAAEGKRLLAGSADAEALADKVQRVVVLAVPVVRVLIRSARFSRMPWGILAASTVSTGIAVRTGVRELQVLASLVAYRLEEATGAPGNPALVKKVAIDLYLKPRRAPDLTDDKLRLARLTRKWLFSGVFGRATSKRAASALDAAERFDARDLAARWDESRPGPGETGRPSS
ncbi:MAG TPA: hypothetical protein VLK36_10480 [Gaiellaceae bacterium]|nr:hypothetical protein [Gaiellaceae bacterium]